MARPGARRRVSLRRKVGFIFTPPEESADQGSESVSIGIFPFIIRDGGYLLPAYVEISVLLPGSPRFSQSFALKEARESPEVGGTNPAGALL
jgi:hypothetical protein